MNFNSLIYEIQDDKIVEFFLELCEGILKDSKNESSGQFTGGYSAVTYKFKDKIYSFDNEGYLRVYKEIDLRSIIQNQSRAKREGEFYEYSNEN